MTGLLLGVAFSFAVAVAFFLNNISVSATSGTRTSLKKLQKTSKKLRIISSYQSDILKLDKTKTARINGISQSVIDERASEAKCENTQMPAEDMPKKEPININDNGTLEVISQSFSDDMDPPQEHKRVTYSHEALANNAHGAKEKAYEFMKWQCAKQSMVGGSNPGKTAQALYLNSISVDGHGNVSYTVGVMAARCSNGDRANGHDANIISYAATGYNGVCPVAGWYRGIENHKAISLFDPEALGGPHDTDNHEAYLRDHNDYPKWWEAHDCLKYESANSLNHGYSRWPKINGSVVNNSGGIWSRVHRFNNLPYIGSRTSVISNARVFDFSTTIKDYSDPVTESDVGDNTTNIVPDAKLCAWYKVPGRPNPFSGSRTNGGCDFLTININWKVTTNWDSNGQSGVKNVTRDPTVGDTEHGYKDHTTARPNDDVYWRHSIIPLGKQYGAVTDRTVSVYPKYAYGLEGRFGNRDAFFAGINSVPESDFSHRGKISDNPITTDAFNFNGSDSDDDDDDDEVINSDLRGTKGMLLDSNSGRLFDSFCNLTKVFDMRDSYCSDDPSLMCRQHVMDAHDRLMYRKIQPTDADKTICRSVGWVPSSGSGGGFKESVRSCVWVPYYYPHGGGDDGFDSNNAVGVIPSAKADEKTHVGKRLHFSYTVLNKNSGSGDYTQTRNIGYSEYAVVLKGKDINQSTFDDIISSNKYNGARVVTPDGSGHPDLSAGNAGNFFSWFFGGFTADRVRSVQKINTGSSEQKTNKIAPDNSETYHKSPYLTNDDSADATHIYAEPGDYICTFIALDKDWNVDDNVAKGNYAVSNLACSKVHKVPQMQITGADSYAAEGYHASNLYTEFPDDVRSELDTSYITEYLKQRNSRGTYSQYGLLTGDGSVEYFGSDSFTFPYVDTNTDGDIKRGNVSLKARGLIYANIDKTNGEVQRIFSPLGKAGINRNNRLSKPQKIGSDSQQNYQRRVTNCSDGMNVSENPIQKNHCYVNNNIPGYRELHFESGDGNISIGGANQVIINPNNRIVVIYAKGSVTINNNVCYGSCENNRGFDKVSHIPSLTIMAKGNINIKSNVTRVDAILISTDGTVDTCSDYHSSYGAGYGYSQYGTCKRKLKINGAIIANTSPHFRRTYGAGNYVHAMPADISHSDKRLVFGKELQNDTDLSDAQTTWNLATSEWINYTPNIWLSQTSEDDGDITNFKTNSATELPVRY